MIYKIKEKHKNVQPYIYNDTKKNQKNMKECDKRNSYISSKLHMICIYFNNDRHPFTKTTSLHFTR